MVETAPGNPTHDRNLEDGSENCISQESRPDRDRPGKIFIGVAWPYANGHLHLGHIAGSLLAPDIFSRFHRMRGRRVLMVSGSDEHGTPITVTADQEGISPAEVSDRYHRTTVESLENLDIEFDLFTRTHCTNHFEVVHEIFLTLMKNGYLEKRTTEAQYCPRCDRFLPDRYVEGKCPLCGADGARGDQCDDCGKPLDATELVDPGCKHCGAAPEIRETEHFFLLLSKLQDRLKEYISDKAHWRKNVRKFTENWLREGLRDRAITRDMTWGIPIPLEGYDDKRIYVWFEAVIGYLAASREWARRIADDGGNDGNGGGSSGSDGIEGGNPDAWKDFWHDPLCRHYYFLGKDNIPFHTIIWPSMLLGYGGLNLPYDVPANEYLRFRGGKFSKSRGVGIFIKDFLGKYDADACRYYLSYNMPEQRDTDFSEEDFITAINNELVANFGNFIHRTMSFTAKNFGEIPPFVNNCAALAPPDSEILERTKEAFLRVTDSIEKCEFKAGIKEIMALSKDANRYFNDKAPWKQIKEDRAACGTTLHIGLKIARALTVMAYPYMPHAAIELWKSLGEGDEPSLKEKGWDAALEPLESGRELQMPRPLFRKLEKLKPAGENGGNGEKGKRTGGGANGDVVQHGTVNKSKKKKKKKGKQKKAKQVDPIGLAEVELKVAFVEEIEDHPDADKLYVLKIDCGGDDRRQLVAGLRAYYKKEEMRHRKIVIVANLKPARLRGVESQGMILAAESGGRIAFLTPAEDTEIGTIVTGCDEGSAIQAVTASHPGKGQIDIMQFATLKMLVGEVTVADGRKVSLNVGETMVDATFDTAVDTTVETAIDMPLCSQCAALCVGERAIVVMPGEGEKGQPNATVLMANGKRVVPEREIETGAGIR